MVRHFSRACDGVVRERSDLATNIIVRYRVVGERRTEHASMKRELGESKPIFWKCEPNNRSKLFREQVWLP